MAWLRIDDGFPEHPKILELGSADRRWTWLCILAWTARQRSPIVPKTIQDAVPKATRRYLDSCVDLGLLDRNENGCLEVHNWRRYQPKDPTKAERQARWRATSPSTVDESVDATVDSSVDESVDAEAVYGDGPRAQERARVPVPSRPQEQEPLPSHRDLDQPEGRKETSNNGDLETLADHATRNPVF